MLGSTGKTVNLTQTSTSDKIFDFRSLKTVTFTGDEINDSFRAFFIQYDRTIQFSANFMQIDSVSPNINQFFDGFVGIAPYSADPTFKDKNFMYQLKQQQKIDHITAAFYIKASNTQNSTIKFGSYDPEGVR